MKYDPYYHAILRGIKMMYSDKAGVLIDYFLASQIIEPMDLSYKWQKFFGELVILLTKEKWMVIYFWSGYILTFALKYSRLLQLEAFLCNAFQILFSTIPMCVLPPTFKANKSFD